MVRRKNRPDTGKLQSGRRNMARRKDDWKLWKTGWQYKTDAPQDKEWNKDRKKLFRKNGHGWWWDPTKAQGKEHSTRKLSN